MLRLGRLGYWGLGLALLASACGVSDDGLQASTARPVVTPAETEVVQGEAPAAGAVTEPAEIEVTPTRMPTATAESEAQPPATDEAAAHPGPSEEQLRLLASLDNYGPVPELTNEVWLNSEPLSLTDLRGKVVMVEFWTFG